MKVLFMGTPSFAVPVLKAITDSPRHEAVGVVCQPDRALKRGKTVIGAVKEFALSRGLKVIQPQNVNSALTEVKAFGADIAVTAAFGQLLRADFLSCFKYGVINVHASLLPKYRGASPIYSAILNGDAKSGVTVMQTELGLDCGDILAAEECDISGLSCTQATVKLSEIGAKLLVKTLDNYLSITPEKQRDGDATVCKTIKKHEQYLDFDNSAKRVECAVRALCEEPCAKITLNGETFKIYDGVAVENEYGHGVVGEVLCAKNKLVIACGEGAFEVKRIQPSGKRVMEIKDFLNGRKIAAGSVCEQPNK